MNVIERSEKFKKFWKDLLSKKKKENPNLDISNKQLAIVADISAQTMSKKINDGKRFSKRQIRKISNYLKCTDLERDEFFYLQDYAPERRMEAESIPYLENEDFTGRTELLAKLTDNLKNEQTAVIAQAIHGLGGIGKTQIALKYTYKHQKEYKVIWWLRAEEETTLRTNYANLAVELKLTTSSEQEEQVKATKSWLKKYDKWLLVFDNAPDPESIHDYIPSTPLGHVIITSRYFNWGKSSLKVNVWSRGESLAYLEKRLHFPKEQQSQANELAEELGDFPLALAQAASYIFENEITIEEYLHIFRTQRQELWENEGAPSEYKPKNPEGKGREGKEKYTVATTWSISMTKVAQVEGAKELITLCAFLAPDNIPIDIIWENASHLPDPLNNVLENEVKRNKAIKTLRSYSLIDRNNNDISIHRLVQTVIRDLLELEQKELVQEWINSVTQLMGKIFPFDPQEQEILKTAQRLISHAEYITTQATEHETLATLLNLLGKYFENIALYSQGKIYLEKALSIREKTLGCDHRNVATSLNNLALLLQEQGKYEEAEPLYRRALEIYEKILGTEHENIAMILHNLAFILNEQEKYGEAESLYRKALAIYEKVLGTEHENIAITLNALAALLNTQGKYEEAESLHYKSLEIYKKTLGPEHLSVATSLNNIALLLDEQGKYEEAESLYYKSLEIVEKTLGKEHPYVAIPLDNLAKLFHEQGKYEEAESLNRKALKIREIALGEEHPDIALTLNNLVGILIAKGKYQEAEPLNRRALEMSEKLLGGEHSYMAISLNNLAKLFQNQGKHKEAEPLYRRAANIFEKKLGKEHPNTIKIRNNLEKLLKEKSN